MTFVLTDDMRHALQSRPVEVEDAETRQVYVILSRDSFREMLRDELLRELHIGFDQADAGRLVEWSPASIKAEGRRRLQAAESA